MAVHAEMQQAPQAATTFAHAVTEAHFTHGMDPNDVTPYAPLLDEMGLNITLPDLHDPTLAEAAFAEGRQIGISSFPTFLIEGNGTCQEIPTIYDPEALKRQLGALMEA